MANDWNKEITLGDSFSNAERQAWARNYWLTGSDTREKLQRQAMKDFNKINKDGLSIAGREALYEALVDHYSAIQYLHDNKADPIEVTEEGYNNVNPPIATVSKPKCDCGGTLANTPHFDWCSIK